MCGRVPTTVVPYSQKSVIRGVHPPYGLRGTSDGTRVRVHGTRVYTKAHKRIRNYGAGPERTTSKTKGTATSPHRGPALVGSQYFDLRHLKNVKTKFRKKI